MTGEYMLVDARETIPQTDSTVATASGNRPPIWTERDAVNVVYILGQHAAQIGVKTGEEVARVGVKIAYATGIPGEYLLGFTRCCIPQSDGTVGTAAGNRTPIRAEDNAFYAVCMPAKRQPACTCDNIPEANGTFQKPTAGNRASIRTEEQRSR